MKQNVESGVTACATVSRRYVDLASQIDFTDAALASSLVPVQCASLAPPAEEAFKTKNKGEPSGTGVDTHTHGAALRRSCEEPE